MMPIKNLIYLLQLEEYDLGRFNTWLKNNPGRVVLEKKKQIDWTLKAKIIFALTNIFNVFTFGNKPLAIKIATRFLSPADTLAKKFIVFLARLKIKRMKNLAVIGITGSYGKTTTKDALAHVLAPKYSVLKTEGNYNTLLGISKTIIRNLRHEHEIFICEMAAYRHGDIKSIAELIKPKIGIITAIGPMHLERFGSMENILNTKSELIEALPNDGVGFLPEKLMDSPNPREGLANPRNAKIEFFSSGEDLLIKLGNTFGMAKEEVLDHLKTAPQTPHRQEIRKISGNITIIDDTYNSNPAGFLSALELLKNTSAEIRILVTPGIIELGAEQFKLNKNVAKSAAKIANYVIIIGETNKYALEEGLKEELRLDFDKKAFWARDLESAKSKLSELATTNSAVLLENDLPDHYF